VTTGRVDLREPVAQIIERLGLDPKYVASMEIRPDRVDVVLFHGEGGRLKGRPAVDRNDPDHPQVLYVMERHPIRLY
jgi:hypothetical protein